MGFETQEQAERWAEELEHRAKERRMEPQEIAWRRLTLLPNHKDLTTAQVELMRSVFDYAWEASKKTHGG